MPNTFIHLLGKLPVAFFGREIGKISIARFFDLRKFGFPLFLGKWYEHLNPGFFRASKLPKSSIIVCLEHLVV